jgi:hypothetical protein
MKKSRFYNTEHLLLLVLLSVVLMISQNMFAQSKEYLLKAGYIEKFTHFVEWPEKTNIHDTTLTFSIAVIGENKFGNAIDKIFKDVKVNNKEVRINYISSIDEINNCMILIITDSKKYSLDEILHYTAGKPILTIGETKGYGKKGVIINMYLDDNYIRYEINRTALNKSGLKISAKLLEIARIITDEG